MSEKMNSDKLLLSAKEAAAFIGIARSTWYALRSEGKIPASINLGGRVLWRKNELSAWVNADCPNGLKWQELRADTS